MSSHTNQRTRPRAGTETRQRTKMVNLRIRPEDHQRLTRLARLRGVSLSMLFEDTVADLLATPLPEDSLTA